MARRFWGQVHITWVEHKFVSMSDLPEPTTTYNVENFSVEVFVNDPNPTEALLEGALAQARGEDEE